MRTSEDLPQTTGGSSRWWWIGGGVFVLALLGVGIYIYADLSAEADLQAALEETNALDPRWQILDLERNRRPIRDEDNSSLLLMSARRLKPQRWPYWHYAGDEDSPGRTPSELHALERLFAETEPPYRLDPRMIDALRTELCRAAECLAETRKVIAMPWGRNPIIYRSDGISTLLPYTQEARDSAGLLDLDALLRTEDGDLEEALASCRGMFNCERCIGDEPTLISILVRSAIRIMTVKRIERILAQGEPPEAALVDVQRKMEAEEPENLLLIGAKGERALMDCLMQAIQRGEISYHQALKMISYDPGRRDIYGLREVEAYLTSGPIEANRAALLRLNNRFVAFAELPVEERPGKLKELIALQAGQPRFARELFPAVLKVSQATSRQHAALRCCIAGLAAERFRQARGRWPERLDEVVPESIEKAPLDPFDGQPLRLLRTEQGIIIYSVGSDEQDDGGKISEKYAEKGTDLGFRLYDVSHRRLPPKPRLDDPAAFPEQ